MKNLLALFLLILTFLLTGVLSAGTQNISEVLVKSPLAFPDIIGGQSSDVVVAPQDKEAAVIDLVGEPGLSVNVTLPTQDQYVTMETYSMTVKDFSFVMDPDGYLCEVEGTATIRIGARILNTAQNRSGDYTGGFVMELTAD